MLAHIVFFQLKDASPEAVTRQIDACQKHLTDHEGTLFFAVGTRTPDLLREVNDRDFHVALHVIFDSRESHDRYQAHERHLQFIAENKDNWQQVRVFDSDA